MERDRKNALQDPIWALSGLGAELFGGIAGMGFVGWAIDRFILGSGHRWMLIFLVIGIIGGGANFIRQALRLNRKAAEEYQRNVRNRRSASTPPIPPIARDIESGPRKRAGHGWFESESDPDDEQEQPR